MSRPSIFGVRHLSPGASWHLNRFLNNIKPTIVLIEGLSDANGLIPDIIGKKTKPPVAILAYTDTMPVKTIVYPLASYSPEYQALKWANENNVESRFIDLPSDIFLGLEEKHEEENDDCSSDRFSFYKEIALKAGESSYETYWERYFEQIQVENSFRENAYMLGETMRSLGGESQFDNAECLVRESYMRRMISMAVEEGHKIEKIAVVVGAYHAPVMDLKLDKITDKQLNELNSRSSKLTLMPYSYFKLSSQSGYGAGNKAPAYFELMWECMKREKLDQLPAEYLSRLARIVRATGTPRSVAEVIEAVRLSTALSMLKEDGGKIPTLADLQDSAITLIGHGERSVVAEAIARVEIGTSIGSLPEGVSQTSIQDDFNRELKRLKLEKYRTTVKQALSLDLRENRLVKSEDSAFLDLSRSFFLHKIEFLGISFAKKQISSQSDTTWGEYWELQWSPEAEIELVESVLLGETIELAVGYKFKEALEECQAVNAAAKLVRIACNSGMVGMIEAANQTLKDLAAESFEFISTAEAVGELGAVVRYGDVRKYDTTPILPLIEELFLQGALVLFNTSNCDNNSAPSILNAINIMNRIALEFSTVVDENIWLKSLKQLSDADDKNPVLSGYACAILLERNELNNNQLSIEVSRRLSPGISADLGAGWFEGLSKRNRYALLSRLTLWEQLADYISSLENDEFNRALVFLRRAFCEFTPSERRQISENLGEIWGFSGDNISELIEQPLTAEEQTNLDELDEFDFDDF